jgi:NAD(P)H-dependent nitrite reductase small subunit
MPHIDTSLKLDDIPVGQSRCLEVGDIQIGLFRGPEGIFAIDNTCPHRGAPLHTGMLNDGVVTCPWHQWQFRLSDGVCTNIPGPKVPTYAIEIRDGAIWVDVKEPA